MKISDKVFKFQAGGEMAPVAEPMPAQGPEQAPAPAEGEDPIVQLIMLAQQAMQEQNCEAAMAVCEGLIQLAQGAQSGPPPQEGQPVYKAGGKLSKRIK